MMEREKVARMFEILVTEGYAKNDVLEFAQEVARSPEKAVEAYKARNDINTRIRQILSELGITPKDIAYEYLVKAVEIVYGNPAILEKAALFGVYREVSVDYHVNPAYVRDSIACITERVWNEMDEKVKIKYFSSKAKRGAIRGINFISDLACYLESQE